MADRVSSKNKGMGQKANGQMNMVGYVIAAGVGFLLLPVLPFVVVLWLLRELLGAGGRERPTPH